MIFFVINQLNISKFLPPQIHKTLIETKLHQFSKFLHIVNLTVKIPQYGWAFKELTVD